MTKQYRVTYERKIGTEQWASDHSMEHSKKVAAQILADCLRGESEEFRNITIESREVSDWAQEAE